jgi:hypothetical protein
MATYSLGRSVRHGVSQHADDVTPTRRRLGTCTFCSHLGMTSDGLKDIVRSTVQLNKDHQFTLKVYTERLEAELGAVDKLLVRYYF